jgi:hypothetical protein
MESNGLDGGGTYPGNLAKELVAVFDGDDAVAVAKVIDRAGKQDDVS